MRIVEAFLHSQNGFSYFAATASLSRRRETTFAGGTTRPLHGWSHRMRPGPLFGTTGASQGRRSARAITIFGAKPHPGR